VSHGRDYEDTSVWYVTPCGLVGQYLLLFSLHLSDLSGSLPTPVPQQGLGPIACLACYSTMKMEVVCASETRVNLECNASHPTRLYLHIECLSFLSCLFNDAVSVEMILQR
jgi:hypothetical protein